MSSTEFRLLTRYDDLAALRAGQKPVLLSAFARDCKICLQPEAEETITAEFSGRIELVKMRVEDVPELEEKLGVELIPTLLLLQGVNVSRFTAIPSREGRNVTRWLRERLPAVDGEANLQLPTRTPRTKRAAR